jgi:class 3 adenylate cyclase
MTSPVPGGPPDDPPAYVVVAGHGDPLQRVPIFDQLFVGRECAGISEHRRLVIADPEISRSHLEIRLDETRDQAFVIDTSSNGTLLNGKRLQRAVPLPITPGDVITISDVTLTFRSHRFNAVGGSASDRTRARFDQTVMVMVVGDIVNYSTISQVTDGAVMAQSLHALWDRLGDVLQAHNGTLSHYAGDALFAVWELARFPNAPGLAIDFALAANRVVADFAPGLRLRGPDGQPIRMGWGVVQGIAAVAAMTRATDAVIGDATNVAFRLAGIAGRQGRAPVVVTSDLQRALAAQFSWGPGESVEIKGRSGRQTIYPVIARTAAAADTPADTLALPAVTDVEPDDHPGR